MCIVDRGCSGDGKAREWLGLHGQFQSLAFCKPAVDVIGKSSRRGIQVQLNILPIDDVGRKIESELAVEQITLEAEFIVVRLVRTEMLRDLTDDRIDIVAAHTVPR